MPYSFNIRQMLTVIFAFGWSDFRLKYRGSILGFLWSFAFPLFKFLVILNITRHFHPDIAHYPLYLFLGILLWEHFAQTTSACITLVRDKAVIFQKILFPRLLLVFSVGWQHLLILGLYLLIFCCAMLFYGIVPGWNLLYLPILGLQATLLALGVGMLLASNTLRYSDIPHVWGVLLQILFWLTPVLYIYRPARTVSQDLTNALLGHVKPTLWAGFDLFIRFQPLSLLLHDARRALLYPSELGMPSVVHITAFSGMVCLLFLIGIVVFQRRSKYFLQEY